MAGPPRAPSSVTLHLIRTNGACPCGAAARSIPYVTPTVKGGRARGACGALSLRKRPNDECDGRSGGPALVHQMSPAPRLTEIALYLLCYYDAAKKDLSLDRDRSAARGVRGGGSYETRLHTDRPTDKFIIVTAHTPRAGGARRGGRARHARAVTRVRRRSTTDFRHNSKRALKYLTVKASPGGARRPAPVRRGRSSRHSTEIIVRRDDATCHFIHKCPSVVSITLSISVSAVRASAAPVGPDRVSRPPVTSLRRLINAVYYF